MRITNKIFFCTKHKIGVLVWNLASKLNQISCHKSDKILIFDPKHNKHDNTGALFDFLVAEGYNFKYQIIHSCKDYKKLGKESIRNVYYVSRIRGIIHFFSAKYVYYRGDTIPILPARGQHVIQMWHGSPCKGGLPNQCRNDGWINPYYTGVFSASKNFNVVFSSVFSVPENKLILCGHPRTDALFKRWPKYNMGEYKKIVLWTPTFRKRDKNKYNSKAQLKNDGKLIPIIDPENFEDVNEHLRKIGVKVVVKLHPIQSLEKYNYVNLDYFILLSHQAFVEKGLDLYKFMTQCDAMITDYSSIYWDYLVLDRPIAFTEDDAEDYAQGRGFIMDNPEKYKPGPKLFTIEDFYSFVDDIADGKDDYKLRRKEMNDYGNPVTDGHSCQRALDCVGIIK